MATPRVSPSIDHLALTWDSIIELCTDLSEQEWKTPTGCPGWTVQDNVSHLIDYEARAVGRPAPDGDRLNLPHTRNALGETNEVGVEARRSSTGAEVLDEFRDVTAARLAQLRALTDGDLAREVTTPAGQRTVAGALELRVMDTWSHEQDIRRALDRPGHDTGPAAEEAVRFFAGLLPIVVGSRATPADGSVVVFEIGEVHAVAIEMTDGRATVVNGDTPPTDRTVTLAMPATTFAALVGGRADIPDDVTVTGDAELGDAVLAVLGFMP